MLDGSMAPNLLLTALGLLVAFAAGLMLGYVLRSYVSARRRRRARSRGHHLGLALSPPPSGAAVNGGRDVVPLVPEIDDGGTPHAAGEGLRKTT